MKMMKHAKETESDKKWFIGVRLVLAWGVS